MVLREHFYLFEKEKNLFVAEMNSELHKGITATINLISVII